MPLPAGFKVGGHVTSGKVGLVPPRAKKIMAYLETLPLGDLLTSAEVSHHTNQSYGGQWICLPVLGEYHQKVDGKLFWGSRKSIAKLRKQLEETESSDG